MDKRIQLTIESLAAGGWGVGRLEGKVVFVPFTAPGDSIRCEIALEKKRFAVGRLIDVTRPSPMRVAAPCPVFGRCGGCQWQHIGYEGQLSAKRAILIDALTRIARIGDPVVPPTVASPRDYGYRTAVDLAFAVSGGDTLVGFYAWRGSDIVAIESCPVASDEINARLFSLARALSVGGFTGGGEVRLLAGTGGKVSAHVTTRGPAGMTGDEAARLAEGASLCGLEITARGGEITFGDPVVSYPGWDGRREISLLARASGFVQANPGANREMINILASFDFSGKRVLELFSGVGNLTFPMAAGGGKVTAVEALQSSVADAKKSAEALGIGGIDFVSGDVKAVLPGLLSNRTPCDVVVLDPPRTGAYPAMETIAALSPPDIIYVSCSPPTLARDVRLLVEKGYRLVNCISLDMFPQTFHVEAICRLTKE